MVKNVNLVLVESPTKARTLVRYLGDGYVVEATLGHVRDLPTKKLGVSVETGFEPEYVMTAKQKERVDVVRKLSRGAEAVYLATDPDREGEAIAWHVSQVLKDSGSRNQDSGLRRIVFHEITERAIKDALEHPRDIDMQLVDAQQARRVVDRLVGYKLSPLLWKKVRRGLSAGRVQSVAVKLVVEREREIEAFVPQEFWQVLVKLQDSKTQELQVNLKEKNEKEIKITNRHGAEEVEGELRGASYVVEGVEKKEFSRTPPPPFTTSSLQQAAANRLGWSAKKTMQVAQGLYEEGYITYHRTDSTNLAMEAVRSAAGLIRERYGERYALESPRFYKTKSKMAQEAHEAIRPTDVGKFSNSNFQFSNKDQERLYGMIWTRFVACQMAEARGETKVIVVVGEADKNKYGLEARGETVTFEGWYKVEGSGIRVQESVLPEVSEGEKLEFVDLTTEQKFTQPPARYNDASLIKALEEMGIGRPSTYAPTLSTIQDRQYVDPTPSLDELGTSKGRGRRYRPTPLGIAVNDFLVANFPKIVDYQFTAGMEDELDEIARGERQWRPTVGEFYEPFAKDLEKVTETTARVKVGVEATGEKCPECREGDVVIRIGRFGKFLACSRYPECKYKANFQNKIGMKCPKCGEGEVIIRKTKFGKSFYGCSNYPKCDFASWTRPSSLDKLGTSEGAAKPSS